MSYHIIEHCVMRVSFDPGTKAPFMQRFNLASVVIWILQNLNSLQVTKNRTCCKTINS